MPRAAPLACLILFSAGIAHAHPVLPGVWGPPTPITGPVLSDVSVNFGALTASGRGAVGIASRDDSRYAFTAKGLDMWDGNTVHTPTKWTIISNGGTGCGASGPTQCFALDGTTTCTSAGSYTTPSDTLNPPTPTLCAYGTTHISRTGTYTFTVTATDALLNTSAPKTLTYTMVDNAISFGDQGSDYSTGKPSFPASWTSTGAPTGATLLVSTGTNYFSPAAIAAQKRLFIKTLDFSHGQPVTMQWADATKPGGLWELEVQTVKNFVLSGLTLSGPWNPKSGYFLEIYGSSDNITVQDVSVLHQASDVTTTDSIHKGFAILTSSRVTVNNFTADYVRSCIDVDSGSTNFTANNTWCRHAYVNFLGVGVMDTVTFNDTYLIAPMRYNGQHADAVQVTDTTAPQNFTLNRIAVVQADGDAVTQGPIFGGRSGAITGYISNGSGKPGNILHVVSVVSGNAKSLVTPLTPIVSEVDFAGNSILAGTTTGAAGCAGANTDCTLAGPLNQIGSAAQPATIFTAPIHNFTVNGAIYVGGTFNGIVTNGESGASSLANFTYVKSNGYNNGQDLAKVTVTADTGNQTFSTKTYNIMTASGLATGNVVGLFSGESSSWDHPSPGVVCNPVATYPGTGAFAQTCTSTAATSTGLGPQLTGGTAIGGTNAAGFPTPTGGTAGGAGLTYQVGCVAGCSPNVTNMGTLSGKIFDFRFDSPLSGGPWYQTQYSDSTVMHSGTYNISSGFMWDNLRYLPTIRTGSGTKPSNQNVAASVFQGALSAFPYPSTHTHDIAQADFANGDPEVTLDAIPTATWAGQTMAQVIRVYAAALAPKLSGDLDAGSGLGWYGAATPQNDSGQYCWNATGTVWDHTKTCAQMGLSVLSAP